jgi:hypothetical protein
MVAAWLVTIALRRVAGRFDPLRYVWHPALFVFAVYIIVLHQWCSSSHAERAMTEVEARRESSEPADRPVVVPPKPVNRPMRARRFRIVPLLITLVPATVAAAFGWAMWKTYM